MRDGENAGELAKDEINHDRMVQLMVGRDVSQFYTRTPHAAGEVVLEVENLRTFANPKHELSFSIRKNEIVGIAGLVGAGRTELLQVLFGVEPSLGGAVRVNGKTLDLTSPQQAIQSGIALVPEDRKRQGIVLEMGVRSNIGLPGLKSNQMGYGWLNQRQEATDSLQMTDRLRIKTPHQEQALQFLSGGNQQKVVLAKWLSMEPDVLLLDEPTRGIDVGAKQEIYSLMEELAASGMAILFVSSEMEEILGMADRVIVMHEGAITGELPRAEMTEESIMQLATGNVAQSA
jgi:ribose transport system ATP-binding protein